MRLDGHWIWLISDGWLILASFSRLGLSWNWFRLKLFIANSSCSSWWCSLGSGLGLLLFEETICLLLIWSLNRFLPLTDFIESFCFSNEVNQGLRQLRVQMLYNVLLLSVGEGRQQRVLHLPASEVVIALWCLGWAFIWRLVNARTRSLLFH